MMNYNNAVQASANLVAYTSLLANGGNVVGLSSLKARWGTLINCVYGLLHPLIHADFPERVEVGTFVLTELESAFLTHHDSNWHVNVGDANYELESLPGTTTPIVNALGPTRFTRVALLNKKVQPTEKPISLSSIGEDFSLIAESASPEFVSVEFDSLNTTLSVMQV